MNYYQLEPEVAGGWGQNTMADTSVHPPHVTRLHYEFSGWSGDCIVESFPIFIITEQVANAILTAGFTGSEIAEVETSISDEFRELYPNRKLPSWRWLKTIGVIARDDIATTREAILVVSEQTLSLLRHYGLKHCNITQYKG